IAAICVSGVALSARRFSPRCARWSALTLVSAADGSGASASVERPAIEVDDLTVDQPAVVGGEPDRRRTDLLGAAEATRRDRPHHLGDALLASSSNTLHQSERERVGSDAVGP